MQGHAHPLEGGSVLCRRSGPFATAGGSKGSLLSSHAFLGPRDLLLVSVRRTATSRDRTRPLVGPAFPTVGTRKADDGRGSETGGMNRVGGRTCVPPSATPNGAGGFPALRCLGLFGDGGLTSSPSRGVPTDSGGPVDASVPPTNHGT